ncbi:MULTISPECIES: hypothetical protein [unclassified Streptomyces]|uniref:hypothetical protein n=1 Tax=unclassified Streptomyces TaxID=2593676 RepID=UPI00068776C5|nr:MULTISPECIES: hypothetical protein [unclassified Streptomyces]MYT27912.1 hypothetical protein [Streptomyces sp. SID8354]
MTEPVHKSLVLFDVEGFGRRSGAEQAMIRRMLYSVVHDTLRAAQVEPTEYRTEDRGDAVLVIVGGAVPKPQLLRAALTETPTQLLHANRLASAGTQVRLRVVLHAGEVAQDAQGTLGKEVVEAFRLLDTAELRGALRSSSQPSVLAVSELIHRSVVEYGHPGIDPEHFHPFVADSKEGALTGWLYDGGRVHVQAASGRGDAGRGTAAEAEAEPPGRAAEAGPGSTAVPGIGHIGSGNFFFGAGPQSVQDMVAGDKNVTYRDRG